MTRGESAEASASSYVTYESAEDARQAIQAINGYTVDGHMIRASYGTTKYVKWSILIGLADKCSVLIGPEFL